MVTQDAPIGVFDSGIGGLTVLKELLAAMPAEDYVYMGDTAHVPYGPKSPDVIKRLTKLNIEFLLEKGVKAIVVACNTASAVALPELKSSSPVPIIGVVEAGARAALETGKKHVAVIGTRATVVSGAYQELLLKADQDIEVGAKACPLFVPLVEEGRTEGAIVDMIVAEYLAEFVGSADVMILGCTHYPMLKKAIQKFLPEVTLVDSAEVTARFTKQMLSEKGLLRVSTVKRNVRAFVTDSTPSFDAQSSMFLGFPLVSRQVSIGV
jgi:glutamate racemase